MKHRIWKSHWAERG